MATILASRGGILRPDYEQDREKTREKIASIRTEACQHDKNGDVMFANEARRHARRLEIMWDLTPRSPYDDPMGVVADALRDQAAAWAEDDDRQEPKMVAMAKAIGRTDSYRRHE